MAIILALFFYRRQEHKIKRIEDIILGENEHQKGIQDFELLKIRNIMTYIRKMLVTFEEGYRISDNNKIDIKIRDGIGKYVREIKDEYDKISLILKKSNSILDPSEIIPLQSFVKIGVK